MWPASPATPTPVVPADGAADRRALPSPWLLVVASSRSPAGNRLGLADRIHAGYELLAEVGIKALKIDRLCDRLGVTKGSRHDRGHRRRR